MSRLLFWIALFCLVIAAIRSKLRSAGLHGGAPAARSGDAATPINQVGQAEAMACCTHCHLYFPASEAVRADGQDYCGQAHVHLPPV